MYQQQELKMWQIIGKHNGIRYQAEGRIGIQDDRRKFSYIEVRVSHSCLYIIWPEVYVNQNSLSYDLFIIHCTSALTTKKKNALSREFPGGPMVRTLLSLLGPGFNPGSGK